jgi:DNA-binding NtrC family response regulator
MSAIKILIVDDDRATREQLVRWLEHEGFKTGQAATAKEALEQVHKANYTVILLDMILPDRNCIALLAELHRDYPDICIIILTAFEKEDTPAQARAAGAFDFFAKPIHFESLCHRIDTATDLYREKRAQDYQREEAKRQFQFENIVTKSAAMQRVFEVIQKVACSDETVLIQGESGTGKDLVAHAIHYNSLRSNAAMTYADCAGLAENLAESELFGHEKGAFTGATARKIGKFEQGEGTTLFLNEVGELTPAMQLKFLRFLQERTFERLGGREMLEADVRVIAATNANLHEAVAQGRFRLDLLQRLQRVVIEIPPLRERRGDIPLLVRHFIKRYNRRNGKVIRGISPAALALENIIAYAILMEDENTIQPETIHVRLLPPKTDAHLDWSQLPYKEAKEHFEREYFSRLLERCHHNVTKVAEFAGRDRSHVTNKLKALGLRGNGEETF